MLIEALERIAQGDYRGAYVQQRVTGEFEPLDCAQNPAAHFSLRWQANNPIVSVNAEVPR